MLSDDGIANNNLDYRRTESVEYITYGVDQFRIRHDISLSGRFIIVVCRDGVRCAPMLHTHITHRAKNAKTSRTLGSADDFGAFVCSSAFCVVFLRSERQEY